MPGKFAKLLLRFGIEGNIFIERRKIKEQKIF